MKKQLALFFVLLMAFPLMAQKKPFSREEALERKNNVSLTLGGNGLFLSLGYDRIILVKPGYFMDVTAGFGMLPGLGGNVIPQQIVFNWGKRNSFLMLGLGGTYEWHKTDASAFTQTETSYHLSLLAGWKKIFRSHLLFSIYASPMIHVAGTYLYQDWPVVPYAGISLGYSF